MSDRDAPAPPMALRLAADLVEMHPARIQIEIEMEIEIDIEAPREREEPLDLRRRVGIGIGTSAEEIGPYPARL